jgi:hypothetical protein
LTRAFTLGQCVYALFYVILYHGYFEKEEPFVSVDVKLDANNLARAPANCSPFLPLGLLVRTRHFASQARANTPTRACFPARSPASSTCTQT